MKATKVLVKIASRKSNNKKIEDGLSAGLIGGGGFFGVTSGTASALLGLGPKGKVDQRSLYRSLGGRDATPLFVGVPAAKSGFAPARNMSKQIVEKAGLPSSFINRKLVMHPGDSLALAAHELAHATSPYINNKLGMNLIIGSRRSLPLQALYAGYKGVKGEDLSGLDTGAMLTASAPLLLEETRANAKALQAIRRIKPRGGVLRSALPLIGSELSYVGAAASPFVAHAAAKWGREHFGD